MKKNLSISWLDSVLPDYQCVDVRCEPDYYGISHLLAQALGRSRTPQSYASWKHGWPGFAPLRSCLQLAKPGARKNNALVHTLAQRDFLRAHGYPNAYAVGMPFVYAQALVEVPRRRHETLLVMPPHISKHFRPRYTEKEYVSQICELRDLFEEIVVCIHGECDRHNRWRRSFEDARLPVILGADIYDRNALVRMVVLFSLFDVVTSPNLGSHIVYASLSGCRVSIWGDVERPSKADFLNNHYYQANPELVANTFSNEAAQWRDSLMTRFRCHPSEACRHLEWAQKEAGLQNMVPMSKLASLLGWDPMTQMKGEVKILLSKVLGRR